MDWSDVALEYYKRHDYDVSSLPADWQRELVALMLVNREVNNGGYLQFLSNHGRETYIYASQALKQIGARKMADLIDLCQALIDEHFLSEGKSKNELNQLLPNRIIDRQGRTVKDVGSVLPKPIWKRISKLSYEFMNYPDDVAELAESYYRPIIEGDKPT